MKKKLLSILLNMFCDDDFKDYIETEFHIFYTVMYETFERNNNDLNGFIDTFLEVIAPYVDIIYQELKKWETWD